MNPREIMRESDFDMFLAATMKVSTGSEHSPCSHSQPAFAMANEGMEPSEARCREASLFGHLNFVRSHCQ